MFLRKKILTLLLLKLLVCQLFASVQIHELKDHVKHGYSQAQLLNTERVTATMYVHSVFDKVSPLMGLFPVRIYIENPLQENLQGKLVSTSQKSWDAGVLKKEFSQLPLQQIKRGYVEVLLPQQPAAGYRQQSRLRFFGENSSLSRASFAGAEHPLAVTKNEPLLIDRLRKEMAAGRSGYRHNEQQQLATMDFEALTDLEDQLLGWNYILINQEELAYLSEPKYQKSSRSFELFLKRGGHLWVQCKQPEQAMLPTDWQAVKYHQDKNRIEFFVGEGKVFLSLDKNIQWSEISKRHSRFFDGHGKLMSKIDDIHTNILGFMLMVFGFALLVGPINLFVICKGNRVKLMLTTPIISLLAVVLFGLLILLIEGIGGEGARMSVTYVDTDRHEHITQVAQVSRTGVVLNSKFDVEDEVFIWPSVTHIGKPKNSRESSEYNLLDQQAVSGWFTSRNIQSQTLIKRSMKRERLELKDDQGQLKLLSTLQIPLDHVWTYDKEGQLVGVKQVTPGSEYQINELDRLEADYLQDVRMKKLVAEYRDAGKEILLAASKRPMNDSNSYSGIDWIWEQHFYIIPVDVRQD